MRFVAAIFMLVAGTLAYVLPGPEEPEPNPRPGIASPPLAICPLVDAAGLSTEVAVLSSVSADGTLSGFAAGSETGSVDFRTGPMGTARVPASSVSVVGFAGGLVELPNATTVAGVTLGSENSLAAESCPDVSLEQSTVVGGSTASGARFTLQLMNPFASPAVANVTVISESGIESNGRFGAVTIPAHSSVSLDMAEIIPGREHLMVDVNPTSGAVLAVGHQRTEARSALWSAVKPQQEWWMLVPGNLEGAELVIGNPSTTAVDFQVDVFQGGEIVEGFELGSIPERSQVRIALAASEGAARAMRVISTSPVVPVLHSFSEHGLAVSTGTPLEATSWLLPGAESPVGGSGRITVLNTGTDTVSLQVRALGQFDQVRTIDLPSGEVLDVSMVPADGYRIDGDGPFVVLWSSELGSGNTLAIGVPIIDG